MAFVVRKTFDWEEDRKNYKLDVVTISKGLANSYRVHKKLSWKGRLRKWLKIQKPKEIKP